MFSNRLALAALGIACTTAAGAGSYLATRQNAGATSASAVAVPATAPGAAVQETEGVVAPPSASVAAPLPAPNQQFTASARPAAPKNPPPAAPTRRPADREAGQRARAEAPTSTLDRTWPSSAAGASATPSAPESTPQAVHQESAVEPIREPEPPAKIFSELVIGADSVIGLQTETALSSERSRLEDRVEARVIRDVRVGGEVAVPAGTRALGSVVAVDRGGKFKERARLGIRFESLVLADGTRLPVSTETIYRYGNAPANGSAAKIGGGAVAGAILGAIIGGSKGAAVGASTGAGAGTAAVVAGDRSVAAFPSGEELTARILSPVAVTVERE